MLSMIMKIINIINEMCFCSSAIEILSRSSVYLIYTFDIKAHCLLCSDVVVVPQSKVFKEDDGYVFLIISAADCKSYYFIGKSEVN